MLQPQTICCSCSGCAGIVCQDPMMRTSQHQSRKGQELVHKLAARAKVGCGSSFCYHCLAGIVVMVSASRAKGPRLESHLRQDFASSSHTSDLKFGTPVTALPGAWHYRVSAWTGWPGVSILRLGEVKIWSATSISVWQHVKLSEQICPKIYLHACMLLGR